MEPREPREPKRPSRPASPADQTPKSPRPSSARTKPATQEVNPEPAVAVEEAAIPGGLAESALEHARPTPYQREVMERQGAPASIGGDDIIAPVRERPPSGTRAKPPLGRNGSLPSLQRAPTITGSAATAVPVSQPNATATAAAADEKTEAAPAFANAAVIARSTSSESSRLAGATKSRSRESLLHGTANDSSSAYVPTAIEVAAASSVMAPMISAATSAQGQDEDSKQKEQAPKRSSSISRDSSLISFDDINLDSFSSSASAKEAKERIDTLKRDFESEKLRPYDMMFDAEASKDVLVVGSVPVEQLRKRERDIELARIQSLKEDAQAHRTRMEALNKRETAARQALRVEAQRDKRDLKYRENRLVKRHHHQVKDQQEAFRKMEDRMKSVLEAQQGELQAYFGDLNEADDLYGAVRGRRYKVDWSMAPRLIRLRVDMLRAVKNKLPRGRYAVMVTLYDRLGGHPLRWSNLEGVKWTGTTPFPRRHNGKYHDLELSFAQKQNRIFLACPSINQARPSNVFVFELFLLRGQHSKVDTVVGWGAFPMSYQNFDIVQGKFKVPLLRGPMDVRLDKYERIEELMASNLDSWLCNMYFDVRHLPRYLNNQKEYEVEMNFTSNLLKLRRTADENAAESDSEHSAGEERGSRVAEDSDEESNGSDTDVEVEDEDDDKVPLVGSRKPSLAVSELSAPGAPQSPRAGEPPVPPLQFRKSLGAADIAAGINADLPPPGAALDHPPDVKSSDLEPALQKTWSEFNMEPALKTSSGLTISTVPVEAARTASIIAATHNVQPKASKGVPSSAEENLRLRRVSSIGTSRGYELPAKDAIITVRTFRHKGLFREQPGWEPAADSLLDAAKADPITRAREMEKYKFSIVDVDRDVPSNDAQEKIRYLTSEILADVQLHRWKTMEFWTIIACVLLVFWFRLYLHCFGQYTYLKSLRIAVYSFDINPGSCDVLYSTDSINSLTELGVVAIGVVSNIIVFSALFLAALTAQQLLGGFPDAVSRFLLVYGLGTLLDPVLILLSDLMRQNWSGDSFKLYNFYAETEGNGVPGIFLTLILTAVMLVVAGFFFYSYLLHTHMNGRMMDVHYRMHGDESSFFVPDDMEVSVSTLRWILTKAKRWAGFHGATRKISVTSHVMRDHLDPSFLERTIHLALYTQDLYGERELYRHFVRRPDGAILEIFDSVELMGADNYANLQKMLIGEEESDPKSFLYPAGADQNAKPGHKKNGSSKVRFNDSPRGPVPDARLQKPLAQAQPQPQQRNSFHRLKDSLTASSGGSSGKLVRRPSNVGKAVEMVAPSSPRMELPRLENLPSIKEFDEEKSETA